MMITNVLIDELKKLNSKFDPKTEEEKGQDVRELGIDSLTLVNLFFVIDKRYQLDPIQFVEKMGDLYSIKSMAATIEKFLATS